MQKSELTVPFVFGSIAFQLNKKAEERSYKWICYVRGVNNENLGFLIDKVVFHLHPSCGDPIRESTSYPFEINQLGWGEFEILIDVHFKLENYPPVRLAHQLRLHHTNPGSQTKKPLCSQVYDQFVFTKLSAQLLAVMQARPGIPQSMVDEQEPQTDYDNLVLDGNSFKSIAQYSKCWQKYQPLQHKARLEDAIRFVKSEIALLSQKMKQMDSEVQKVYEDTIK